MFKRELDRWRNLFNQRVQFKPFTIAYQPIVDVRGSSIWGYEALVRGEAGESYPKLTEGMTERRQGAFDRLALAKSLRLASALGLREMGVRLTLNLRPGALAIVSARYVARAARTYGIPVESIVLEMTEDSRITPQQMKEILTLNRQYGMQTAIDDFGAGYAGLSQLAGSQADILKLDRELIRGIDTCQTRQTIIAAILRVSSQLHKVLVAEGVETNEESRALRELGVSHMQGYWFARPAVECLPQVAADKLNRRLLSTPQRTAFLAITMGMAT